MLSASVGLSCLKLELKELVAPHGYRASQYRQNSAMLLFFFCSLHLSEASTCASNQYRACLEQMQCTLPDSVLNRTGFEPA